ncbi:hypothetical protein MMC25_005256 [Agyrium rufum]|nr:hypothetical protein [Agyrium rufum]
MASLNFSIVTFNCGRELVDSAIFASHLSSSVFAPQFPDLLIFSLQETAPIAYSFLGGSFLVSYFDGFRYAVDLAAKSAGGDASYVSLIVRNVGMTAIMIFIRAEHANRVRWISTAGAGVGAHEMGNKGGVGVRLGFAASPEAGGDQTMEMTFVAAHLAPMEEALERRNQDWKDLVQRLVFTPVTDKAVKLAKSLPPVGSGSDSEPLLPGSEDNGTTPSGGLYRPTSHLFLAGDLNYRTSRTKPSPQDTSSYPQATTDQSDPKHYRYLLERDQLSRELRARRTCHGLTEAPIDFPPTYKYSDEARLHATHGAEGKWLWAKHRWPSWCDRILYLDLPHWASKSGGDDSSTTAKSSEIRVQKYDCLPLMKTSDHRAVVLVASVPLEPIPAPPSQDQDEGADGGDDHRLNPPFDIDPTWRERRAVARRKEIAVGLCAYLALTWEGNGVLVALMLGALGGWAVISSALAR